MWAELVHGESVNPYTTSKCFGVNVHVDLVSKDYVWDVFVQLYCMLGVNVNNGLHSPCIEMRSAQIKVFGFKE